MLNESCFTFIANPETATGWGSMLIILSEALVYCPDVFFELLFFRFERFLEVEGSTGISVETG